MTSKRAKELLNIRIKWLEEQKGHSATAIDQCQKNLDHYQAEIDGFDAEIAELNETLAIL